MKQLQSETKAKPAVMRTRIVMYEINHPFPPYPRRGALVSKKLAATIQLLFHDLS